MSQDSPATDAGTESRTTALRSAFVRGLDRCREIKETYGTWPSLTGRVELAGDEFPTDGDTPDTWAPINRRTMRDDVDRFRNERMPVPQNGLDALRVLALSMEYYEHASEVFTRTAAAFSELDAEGDKIHDDCIRAIMTERDPIDDDKRPEFYRLTGGRYSKSQTGAEKLVDLAPAMATYLGERRELATKKAEAEKEMGVARRRHATAITYSNAFIFFSLAKVEALGVGHSDAAARADVAAGDTDRASLAEQG